MRKPITPTGHLAIDYCFLATLFAGPSVLGLHGRARTTSYAIGLAAAAVVLGTRSRITPVNAISSHTHGKLDAPFIPLLLAGPAIAGAMRTPRARKFFLTFFGMALTNFLLTDYDG